MGTPVIDIKCHCGKHVIIIPLPADMYYKKLKKENKSALNIKCYVYDKGCKCGAHYWVYLEK